MGDSISTPLKGGSEGKRKVRMIIQNGTYGKEKYQRKSGRLVTVEYDLKRKRLLLMECDTKVSIGKDNHK